MLSCHIGLLFGKRVDTILVGHRVKKYLGLLFTCYYARCRFIFSTLQSRSKICGFANEFARCVWTGGISRKKKLQIKNYPNACGRGHNSA